MRPTFILFILCLCCGASFSPAQTSPGNPWSEWAPFIGTWQGTGSDGPGQGTGEFTFAPELQGAVLTRRNFAEYPAANDKPAFRHDDLMVIYHNSQSKTRADYWDSEGHMIHYEATLSPSKLVFLSDPAQPGPRYRLTYAKTDTSTLSITFEIAPSSDPSSFKTYISATARRKT